MFRIEGTKRSRQYATLAAALKTATRKAAQTEQAVTILKETDERYGLSLTSYRLVSPDGTIRRWERGEWLLSSERKTKDGRIISTAVESVAA